VADIYEQLAERMSALPNGFPRLASGVEVDILRRIFTPEQAAVAAHLQREAQTPAQIAAHMARDEKEISALLKDMARAELVWPARKDRALGFRLAPFVVGVYEAHLWQMDRASAELFERYMAEGGAKALMQMQPPLQRVIPAQESIEAESILPYDDVKKLMLRARGFSVRDCVCRHERSLLGKACAAPVHNCLSFGESDRPPHANTITQAQALAILDQSEVAGLVHTVMNTVESVFYVCNCCGCCCALLRGLNEYGESGAVARANYYAEITSDECSNCGVCFDRCQVHAIVDSPDGYRVDRARCIGCGLCITGCPSHAARLYPLPAAQIVHPPKDFAAWEEARLARQRDHQG
jgi:Pyruvate/2-oxoacid:ferredoxin oxidoreductase delta subunit